MTKIWKYELKEIEQILRFPTGSQLMHLGVQAGKPCIWMAIAASGKDELWSIKMLMTGAEIKASDGEYIGTLLLENDQFVVHVFMKKE